MLLSHWQVGWKNLLYKEAGIWPFCILHRGSLFWSMTPQERHGLITYPQPENRWQNFILSILLYCSYLVACYANNNHHLQQMLPVPHPYPSGPTKMVQSGWCQTAELISCAWVISVHYHRYYAHMPCRPEVPRNSHFGSNPQSATDGNCYIKFQFTNLWINVIWGVRLNCFLKFPCGIQFPLPTVKWA